MKKGIRRVEFFPPEWDLGKCFDLARTHGFQGMELIFRSGPGPITSTARASGDGSPERYHPWQTLAASITLESTEAECVRLSHRAEGYGIQICSLAAGHSVIGPPGSAEYTGAFRYLGEAIQRASWLGGSTVLVSFEKAMQETPDSDARIWVTAMLTELRSTAEKHGISLAYELVWPAVYTRPEEFRSILEGVDSPYVGCNFDPANIIQQFGNARDGASGSTLPEKWLRELIPKVVSIHMKDYSAGNGPAELLSGDVDWGALYKTLKTSGYSGWLIADTEVGPRDRADTLVRVSSAMDRFIEGKI